MKRFYTDVAIAEVGQGFRVELDGRPVKTPARAELTVPTHPLAEALVEEWAAQAERVDPQSMPLSQLAITAIDRIAPQRDVIIDELARYGATDLTCYFAEGPDSLCRLQWERWEAPRRRLAEEYGVALAATEGIVAIRQAPDALDQLRALLAERPVFRLTGVQSVTAISGSLVLGLALECRWMSAESVSEAAFVDEYYQLEQWGEDAEARARLNRLSREIANAERFLDLL